MMDGNHVEKLEEHFGELRSVFANSTRTNRSTFSAG